MAQAIVAIDQGTTSTRCMVFDHEANVLGSAQASHEQRFPRPGWVEHDALEIWQRTREVIRVAIDRADVRPAGIAAVGVTNQRETTVVWDRRTGKPYANAIVWQDTRTDALCRRLAGDAGPDRYRSTTGLPLATYFAGPKLRWLLDEVEPLRDAAERGDALFGTIDTWLIWNLTGGPAGGRHVTDPTNASRTMLMDLETLDWDEGMIEAMGIPRRMLPQIAPSSSAEAWGRTKADGPVGGAATLGGVLGDQQAALVGQCCFEPGAAKSTYGTGCFLLMNSGEKRVDSSHGLLTTVAYQLGRDAPCYALEGSIAVAGALVQWLVEQLAMFKDAAEVERIAGEVADNGGVYIVPAFSGLFAPYWRSEARGVIAGLTRFANRAHLARAALEAVAYQVRDVAEAMVADAGLPLTELRADGGMVGNELLMRFQADVLDAPVTRPTIRETTSLGAAYAAGLAVGFWPDLRGLQAQWQADRTWRPNLSQPERRILCQGWRKAVERTLGWVDSEPAQ